jgi:hypothetical protein
MEALMLSRRLFSLGLLAVIALPFRAQADDFTISADGRAAIAEHVSACWNPDAAPATMDNLHVTLTVTVDAAGIARVAVVAGPDVAKLSDPVFRAFTERAVRATLDPQCSHIPLPDKLLGMTHQTDTVTFRFTSPPTRSHAEAVEPSARRLYMLCAIEDPQCAPSIVNLAFDVVRNPTWNGNRFHCISEKQLTEEQMHETFGIFLSMAQTTAMPARLTMIYALRCRDH